jgi:hypothetical protein
MAARERLELPKGLAQGAEPLSGVASVQEGGRPHSAIAMGLPVKAELQYPGQKGI